ncbi:MAG: VWA domain-containing protein [Gammaproteobacteria bacterium HGW-Gammaproteobacteria-2]|jgi:hypothetical protein|nr:MAG: VWA domain-containing protein [Gammaproteobacteria bacterium HGW-Gammaproteobacteria-2]
MARNRRTVNTANLAFIDAMSVGLGAVILLFMILHHASEVVASQKNHASAEKVSALEDEVLKKRQAAAQMAAALQATQQQLRAAQARAASLTQELKSQDTQGSGSDDSKLASLKSEVLTLQARVDALRATQAEVTNATRERAGEGTRQYLAGLEVKGKRILILVDVSASMLDETVVGVIRARNMDAATQRASAKWRWALNALDWITTQVPATAQFQVYAFNTTVESAVAGTTGNWLAVGNGAQLSAAVSDLRQRLPTGGTSLTRAFAAAARLSPQPDNIYLLTDGLPTQGAAIRGGLVSGDQRMDLFAEALRAMPRGIAIHTLLFPMDGDSKAAGAYWQLAQISGGSFLAPSRDWP